MKPVFKNYLLLIFTAGLTAVLQVASGELSGDFRGVHDPAIVKEGTNYYVFSTGQGIVIRQSHNLREWTRVGRVFENVPEWTYKEVPGFRGYIWAPDILYIDGRFALFYSVSTFGKNRSCIGLATNKTLTPNHPDNRWIDCGKVIESFPQKNNYNAIDPNVIIDDEGKVWLAFGSFWEGIKLTQLDRASLKPIDDPPKLITIASRPGNSAIEAPFIIYRKPYYYLFASFDLCCRGTMSTYKIAVGRATKVTGEYRDKSGKSMLEGGGTVILQGHNNWIALGHNAVLKDGNTYWLVYHGYDANNSGRAALQIRKILWTEYGWFTLGDPP